MSRAGCYGYDVVSEGDVCCNLLGSIDTQSQSQLLPMNEWIPGAGRPVLAANCCLARATPTLFFRFFLDHNTLVVSA